MNKKTTIVVVPQKTSQVFRLQVLDSYFLILRWIMFGLFLVTCYVVFQFVVYLKNSHFFAEMTGNYELQEVELQRILKDLDVNTLQLGSLTSFDDKLRLILGIKDKTNNLQLSRLSRFLDDNNQARYNSGSLSSNRVIALISQVQNENQVSLKLRQQSFADLEGYILEAKNRLLSTPSVKPVKVGYLTSNYGLRTDPFLGIQRMHYGIDWAFLPYTPIYATANGVVKKVYYSISYGNVVVIDHGNKIRTLYAHLAEANVKVGQRVSRGQLIARMGNTGKRSTATHLHYEVLLGNKAVNPANYILEELPEITAQFSVEF